MEKDIINLLNYNISLNNILLDKIFKFINYYNISCYLYYKCDNIYYYLTYNNILYSELNIFIINLNKIEYEKDNINEIINLIYNILNNKKEKYIITLKRLINNLSIDLSDKLDNLKDELINNMYFSYKNDELYKNNEILDENIKLYKIFKYYLFDDNLNDYIDKYINSLFELIESLIKNNFNFDEIKDELNNL